MRQPSGPAALVLIGLLIVLAIGIVQFPGRVNGYIRPVLPLAQLWFDPTAQHRAAAAPAPYELLRQVDALLPANARVLLVIDSVQVQRREYVTFHRALYYLVPRPVWWISPVPSDGTWEARWWQSAPVTPDSILQLAREKGADYLLLAPYTIQVNGTRVVGEWSDGALLALQPTDPPTRAQASLVAGEGWWWRSAAALLSTLLLGGLWVMLAARVGLESARVEGIALAWALGAGSVSFALVGMNLLGVPLGLQLMVLAGVALASGLVIARSIVNRRRERKRHSQSLPQPEGTMADNGFPNNVRTNMVRPNQVGLTLALSALLIVWLFVQTVFVAIIALGQPLTFWDSWVTWGMKARAIFVEQAIGPAVFADPSRAVTHLDYPLLLPLVEAWLYQWLGAPDDRLVGWIAVAFYLALVGVCYAGARRLGAGQLLALLAAAVVGSMPTLTLLAGQVYADVPLAVFALLTSVYLVVWIERGNRGALLIAVCGAACLPWIKREGLILLFALCGTTLMLTRGNARAWRGALMCLGGGILVAGVWFFFLTTQGTNNSDFEAMSFSTAISQSARLPTITNYFFNKLGSLEWSGVWLLIPVVCVVRIIPRSGGARFRLVPHDILLMTPVVYLVVMAASYLFSAFTPFINHLNSSGYRLIAQVTPLVVVWVTLQAAPRTPAGVVTGST